MNFRHRSALATSALGLALLTLLPSSAAPAADAKPFEGRIDSTLTVQSPGKPATVLNTSIFASAAGTLLRARSDANHRASLLRLSSVPRVSFLLNEEKKVYVARPQRETHANPQHAFAVSGQASASVNGYSCTRAVLTATDGTTVEVWVAPGVERIAAVLNGEGAVDAEAVAKALRKANIEGWPVKVVNHGSKVTSVWELKAVEAKRQPSALFDLSSYKVASSEGDE